VPRPIADGGIVTKKGRALAGAAPIILLR